MAILLFILLFFLLIIIILLFLPIEIIFSSDEGVISIKYGGLMSAGIKGVNDDIEFYFKMPFWKKKSMLIEYLAEEHIKSIADKEVRKKKKKKLSQFSKTMLNRFRKNWRQLIRTFRVKKLEFNMDTDDYILNAYLFPVIQYLKVRYQKPMSINFNGITRVEIIIRNRIVNIIYALIK